MKKEYLSLVVANFVWASGHPLAKFVLKEIHFLHMAMLSSVLGLAAIGLALLSLRKWGNLRSFERRDFLFIFMAGLLMFSLYPILTFSALARIPASLNSLIIGSNPIFVTLLSWLLLRERTTGRALLGVALAFLGLATVILGTSGLGLQRLDLLGVSISLTGAFTAGTYPILGRVVMRKGDALAATALAHLVGSILLSFLVAQTLGFQPIVEASFPVKAIFTYWGVGAAFAYVIYYWVLKKMEARKAGSFNYLVPIFATILSFLLLGENLGLPFFGGMALTFLGIKLAQE